MKPHNPLKRSRLRDKKKTIRSPWSPQVVIEYKLQGMFASLAFPIAPGRKVGACVCLLAVLLLWTPAWAMALQSHQMDCCSGGMCAAHSHRSKSNDPAPIDCDHHGGSQKTSGLADCSMSCCQSPERPAAIGTVFVLPLPAQISVPVVGVASHPQLTLTAFAHTPEPITPPPRPSFLPL